MASPQKMMDLIILVGQCSMISKHFLVGVITLWFYDYFLTLRDEIVYAWSGRNSPILVLFLLNRYWPLCFLLWLTLELWSPTYTTSMCNKTSWFNALYFTLATLFAQVAIALRVYAVTGNNRWIGASLSLVTLVQFGFGVYLTVRFSLQPGLSLLAALGLPDLPFDEFRLCTFLRWRPGELIYTALSLVYDALAFSLIVCSARKRLGGDVRVTGIPSLLDKIVRDGTTYFLVIFSSHLLLIFFEFLAPEPIQLLPASANMVLVPVMATRLMLSLRKAARPPSSALGLNETSEVESVRFARDASGGTEGSDGDFTLKPLSSRGSDTLPEP